MATLLIDKFMEATLSITNNEHCNFLILPEAANISTSGQIISADGGHSAEYDSLLETFALSVKGDGGTGKLTVGGNFSNNIYYPLFSGDFRSGNWTTDFAVDWGINVSKNFNIFHAQFNNNDVSGAVKFHGSDNKLILTSQNGAADSTLGYKDDNILIGSVAYGIYPLKTYGVTGAPSAPNSRTVAYTIYATEKLTVVSDLAGQIGVEAAAYHKGYHTQNSEGKLVYNNDSSNNTVIGAGIKAKDLVLDGNFRASISACNNSDSFENALLGALGELDVKGKEGTFIGGYAAPTASNNTVATYGIAVDSSLTTAEKSIWSGAIFANTSNVTISAAANDLRPGSKDDKPKTNTATLTGNVIAAYGIKSEDAIDIKSMGTLRDDSNNDVPAYFDIQLNDNAYNVLAIADDDKGSNSKATLNSSMHAVAIDGKTVTLGEVTEDVKICVKATGNTFTAEATNKDKNILTATAVLNAIGINASSTATLSNFAGSIVVDATGNTCSYTGGSNLNPPFSNTLTAAGIKAVTMDLTKFNGWISVDATRSFAGTTTGLSATTLKSKSNLYGTITVACDDNAVAFGINAATITVNGSINTEINSSTFGIYTTNLVASAFSGTITNSLYGINANATLKSDVAGDMFDMNGTINATDYGILSAKGLNLRVSGTIETEDTAIWADAHMSENGKNPMVGQIKYDDRLDIADTAYITGNIELGGGRNTVTVNSKAKIDGSLLAEAGEINLYFYLDGDAQKRAVFQTGEFHDDDKSLKDSMTFTVNANYAENGEWYDLFSYGFDASEYWQNRQIAFSYHGKNVTLTLGNDLTGKAELDGVTFYAKFENNTVSVQVTNNEKSAALDLTGKLTEKYDAGKEAVTIEWKDINAADYDLHEISFYELEYWLDGADNSIVVRLGGTASAYTITGVANGADLRYRMRVLGDSSASSSSYWSENNIANTTYTPPVEEVTDTNTFKEENMTTSVGDANPQEGTKGVVAAIAELSWSKMESEKTIRNYEIEYCVLEDTITIDELNGEDLSDYVANTLFGRNDITLHNRLVTGTELTISNLQNQTYVYWRIRAIDSTGSASDWVAGKTFRVWASEDTVKPYFEKNDKGEILAETAMLRFETPDAAETESGSNVTIGWDQAWDNESGIRAYIITLKDNRGKTTVFEVNAETQQEHNFGIWQDTERLLDQKNQYQVVVNGQTLDAELRVDKDGYISLAWNSNENIEGPVTIKIRDGKNVCTLQQGDYTFKSFDFSAKLEDLPSNFYSYEIRAEDYFGNVSKDAITGEISYTDKGAPNFANNKAVVTLERNERIDGDKTVVEILPTITWSEAADLPGDKGIRYYEFSYRAQGSEEWEKSVIYMPGDTLSWSPVDGSNAPDWLDMGVYEYKIVAYDFFDKTDTISGTFGMTEIDGPEGEFKRLNSYVDATYKETFKEVVKPVIDEDGKEKKDEDGNVITEKVQVVDKTVLESATVTLAWVDNFTDKSGVIYKVTVSGDANLSPDANTYTFWTAAGEKQMVFDTTSGRNVGIFENMKTVYWTVVAYDSYYNETTSQNGGIQSFEFKNKYDKYIVLDSTFNAPTAVKITADNMVEGVHDGNVGLSWTLPDTPTGVYKYTVNIYDKTGKKLLYSADTLDLEGNFATDMKNAVAVSGKTLTIADLRKFIGAQLEDGNYKVSVIAHDTLNRKSESQKVDFVLDTVRPGMVEKGDCMAIPNNAGSISCDLVFRWNPVEDVQGIKHYVVEYQEQGAESWTKAIVTGATEYVLKGLSSSAKPYNFRVYAVDNSGNEGIKWANGKYVTIEPLFDHYAPDSTNFALATKVNFTGDRLVVADTVGQGDTADTFVITTTNSMTLSLTAKSLSSIIGTNDDLKINIYEKSNPKKVWKSFSVKDTVRVFSELLLDSNTEYLFQVVNTASAKNVSGFELVFDKTDLPSDNSDDTRETAALWDVQQSFTDWVGKGDKADWRKLDLSASGKYTFELRGAGENVKLTVYELLDNGKLKSLGTVTAGAKNQGGVYSKELLLDKNKEYYVEVKPGNANAMGTGYELSTYRTEEYTTATSEDDLRSTQTTPSLLPESTELTGLTETSENTKTGWVGFGDATDFYRLEIGDKGGVYNFTVSHDLGSDEAVKLVVYELLAADADGVGTKFRTVKSITLANTAEAISTGSLYLKGDKGGVYFVEVTATGAAKALNSNYTITTDGYNIADKQALPDTGADTVEEAAGIAALTVDSADVNGWVGIGDTTDCYKFTISDDKNYTLNFNGINGKEFSAVISYFDTAKGKMVKLSTLTGAANATDLVFSKDFTAGEYFLEITAKGKTANSEYTFSFDKSENTVGYDPAEVTKFLSAGATASDWVGAGDATDVYTLDITENGYYDLDFSGIANNVKITVKNEAGKSVGSVTLNGSKPEGTISGMLLQAGGNYTVEVTATGAAKGQSTNYSMKLVSQSEGELTINNVVNNEVGPSDKIDSYTLTVTAPKVQTFDLFGYGFYKLSIVDVATGKAVATFTSNANNNYAALTYEFKEAGDYVVKIESNSKTLDSGCRLELIDRSADIAKADNGIGTANTDLTGWVGKGDKVDYIKVDMSQGTGIYDLCVLVDNNAKITIYSVIDGVQKAIKSVTATAAKMGELNGLLLDGSVEYYVAVQASNVSGTKDVDYDCYLSQSVPTPVEIVDGDGWVGFGDATDRYSFTATTGATSIALALGGNKGDITVQLYTEEGVKVGKSFTLNAKTDSAAYTYLLENGNYYFEVVSKNAAKGAVTDFVLEVENFELAADTNNNCATATALALDTAASGAVWQTGRYDDDKVDYFVVNVDDAGCYMLDLAGISGNVTLAIGTLDAKGNFKQLQKVSAKAGADALALARNLAAGTYYIKLESSAKNSASQYELTMTNNSAKAGFSNADDTWKLVANDVDAHRYAETEAIKNWVGFGDAVDVFKLRTADNGVLLFTGDNEATIEALIDKEITLTLTDVNGKSVALTFDAIDGAYVSKNILLANTDYYLQIKAADAKTGSVDYQISFSN